MKPIIVCGTKSSPCVEVQAVGYKETTITWIGQGSVVVSDTNVPITDDIASALAIVEQLAMAHEVDTTYEQFRRSHCKTRRKLGGRR